MSTANEALVWAWRQEMPSKASAKFLLVAIAGECSRDDGGPFRAAPGHARLASLTGMNKSTIVRLLGYLVADGFITRERGPVDAEGHRSRDVYELPVAVVTSVAKRPETARSVQGAKSNVAKRHHPNVANQADLSCTLQQQVLKDQKQDQDQNLLRPPASRGTRIDPNWVRSAADIAWQATEEITDEFAREHTAEFKDWFLSAPGQKGVKTNWSLTWRNWMRKARRDAARRAPRDFQAEREAQIADRVRRRALDPLASARPS